MQKQNVEPAWLLRGRATCRDSEDITWWSWRWCHKTDDSRLKTLSLRLYMYSPPGPTFHLWHICGSEPGLNAGGPWSNPSIVIPSVGSTHTQSERLASYSHRNVARNDPRSRHLPETWVTCHFLTGTEGFARERQRADREENVTRGQVSTAALLIS